MTRPDSPLAPAVAGATVHTLFLLAAFAAFSATVADVRDAHGDLAVSPSQPLNVLIRVHRVAGTDLPTAALAAGAFALLDAGVLYYLGRPARRRPVAREVWNGLAFAVPFAAVGLVAGAAVRPALRAAAGVTAHVADRYPPRWGPAARAKAAAVAGTWVRDGETFTLRAGRDGIMTYTWATADRRAFGLFWLDLRRNPAGVELYDPDDRNARRFGLYRADGDTLTLVLGPRDAVGDDLPGSLDDRRPGIGVYEFRRQP